MQNEGTGLVDYNYQKPPFVPTEPAFERRTGFREDTGSGTSYQIIMRFICDSTVGKLARLLRSAGYDTAYLGQPGWREVVRLALEEKRTILSRNSIYENLKLAPRFLLLRTGSSVEQFVVVAKELDLIIDPKVFLTRCLECNTKLLPIEKEQLRRRLWDYVAETQKQFHFCVECDNIYWHATHARAMVKRLHEIKERLEKRDS